MMSVLVCQRRMASCERATNHSRTNTSGEDEAAERCSGVTGDAARGQVARAGDVVWRYA